MGVTAVLADGRTLTALVGRVFDVLSFYALCAAECSSPVLTDRATTARVTATGDSDDVPDRLVFTVGQDQWTADFDAACYPDGVPGESDPDRTVTTVDVPDRDKVVELRWSKNAVQWATNNGSSQWKVCLAAACPFPAVDPSDGHADEVVTGEWWVGELQPCPPTPTSPCVESLRRQGGEQLATAVLPNVPGDPRTIQGRRPGGLAGTSSAWSCAGRSRRWVPAVGPVVSP